MSGLSVGRALTNAEQNQYRQALSIWRTPDQFNHECTKAEGILGYEHMMLDNDATIRDAHVANLFAHELGAEYVRIGADPPDFEIKIDDEIRRFEVTEVMMPGRKRDAEMRNRLSSGTDLVEPTSREIFEDAISSETRIICSAIKSTADKKIRTYEKRYPNGAPFGLVVYINVGRPEIDLAEFYGEAFFRLTEAVSFFDTVWFHQSPGPTRPWFVEIAETGILPRYNHIRKLQ